MGEAPENPAPVNVIVLMGVSGCGKTTVGKLLSASLRWPFYDGDEFQPVGNISKMTQGFHLTDADRAPWLKAIGDLLAGILERKGRAVLACSLLKADYREQVLGRHPGVALVHLKGPYGLIENRLKGRAGHFFKSEMLAGQYEILEDPDAVTVAVDRDPSSIASDIRSSLGF